MLNSATGVTLPGRARGATHEHDLADGGDDFWVALDGQREVGERRDADQRQLAGFGQHPLDQIADAVVEGGAVGIGQSGAAEAVVAVPVTGFADLTRQRAIGARSYRDVARTQPVEDAQRVARGQVQADVAGDSRDGLELNRRRGAAQTPARARRRRPCRRRG